MPDVLRQHGHQRKRLDARAFAVSQHRFKAAAIEGDAIGDEELVEQAALGKLRDVDHERHVVAGVRHRVRVSPGCEMVPAGMEEHAEMHRPGAPICRHRLRTFGAASSHPVVCSRSFRVGTDSVAPIPRIRQCGRWVRSRYLGTALMPFRTCYGRSRCRIARPDPCAGGFPGTVRFRVRKPPATVLTSALASGCTAACLPARGRTGCRRR